MTSLRIGDFARLGGVSVRTLRHYHDLDLLVPSFVDPITGYRFYDGGQLTTLARIVTLRDVGLPLATVDRLVNGGLATDEVRALLTDRKAEIRDELVQGGQHLAAIDRYLADLEVRPGSFDERTSSPSLELEVEVKSVPSRLVAQVADVAESWHPDDIGPVIAPLYPRLIAALEVAEIRFGQSMAWYCDTDDERIAVHATVELADRPIDTIAGGVEVVELPGRSMMATTVHRGPMEDCDETYRSLLGWVAANGFRALDYGREIDLDCGPGREWITEIQVPVSRAGARGPVR